MNDDDNTLLLDIEYLLLPTRTLNLAPKRFCFAPVFW